MLYRSERTIRSLVAVDFDRIPRRFRFTPFTRLAKGTIYYKISLIESHLVPLLARLHIFATFITFCDVYATCRIAYAFPALFSSLSSLSSFVRLRYFHSAC